MQSDIDTTLQDVFDNTKPSKNYEITCYKLMVKCIEVKPDLVPKDLEPYLKPYCDYHELDYSDYAVEISLGLKDGLGAIVEATRKLKVNPWRVELPERALDTPDLSEIATVCFYLSEAAKAKGLDTFYFSTRDAGKLIDKSHNTAAKRLRLLRKYGILALSDKAYWDDEKKARMAASFTFISQPENENVTQSHTQTHTQTHPPTQPTENYDAEVETRVHCTAQEDNHFISQSEAERVEDYNGGGGDATQLFESTTPPKGNLGSPDDIINNSVDGKPPQLNAIPYQEQISELGYTCRDCGQFQEIPDTPEAKAYIKEKPRPCKRCKQRIDARKDKSEKLKDYQATKGMTAPDKVKYHMEKNVPYFAEYEIVLKHWAKEISKRINRSTDHTQRKIEALLANYSEADLDVIAEIVSDIESDLKSPGKNPIRDSFAILKSRLCNSRNEAELVAI